MPHSLRAKLSGLRYKGILEDKDYKRLCKALDNEKVLEQIRAEIKHLLNRPSLTHVIGYDKGFIDGIDKVLQIIDKYKGDKE